MAFIHRRFFNNLDYTLLISVLILAGFGLLGISSATQQVGSKLVEAQSLRIALGLVVCLIIASIDYHRLTDHAPLIYAGIVLLLLATLLLGTEIKGSRSWIVLGGFRIQPSELAKVAVIIALARYVGERQRSFLRRKQLFNLFLIFLVPVSLIVLQRDLGTAMMFVPILAAIMMVGGVKLRFLLVLVLIIAILAPAGWLLLEDYQKNRILLPFQPELDPQGVGYQVRQSKIAVGSGGLLGKGLGQGLQSQLGFVPEVHTDFIFAILVEEIGFVGGVAILLIYLFVLLRIVGTAEIAQDRVGLLIVAGASSLIFAQVVTNLGMILGVLPAIGIPLPFISYGGSSTLALFATLGLVLNVRQRRFVN